MDINNENNYRTQESETISNSVNKDSSKTISGINDISRSFWDEINNEIASNEMPLWRMWR